MRMEELSENRYIKGADTVEKYLLDLVRDFFKQQDFQAPESSREFIIEKAVERMREELSFEEIGVLTIKLPDGTERTGIVNITLEDLGGEPAITHKRSAFNVPFGDKQNTACEGNDPRLSDKRTPLEHQHDVSDIVGLQGTISTLQGKLERMVETSHNHNNLEILDKLDYTGANTTIDLTILDNFESIFEQASQEIEDKITAYRQRFESNVTALDARINSVLQEISSLEQYAASTCQTHLQDSKDYTDSKVNEFNTTVQAQIDELVTRDLLAPILEVTNNTNTLVGSMEFPFSSVLHHIPGRKRLSETISIDGTILEELTNRGQTLRNCQIECFLEYKHPDVDKKVKVLLPYIVCTTNGIDGSLQVSTLHSDNKIMIALDTQAEQIADELLDSKFIYNVYSTQPVAL